MTDQLVQECWLQKIGFFADEWLLCQDDLFGGCGVGGQEAPVDVAPVPEIGVVRVLFSTKISAMKMCVYCLYLEFKVTVRSSPQVSRQPRL